VARQEKSTADVWTLQNANKAKLIKLEAHMKKLIDEEETILASTAILRRKL
jgi:hypothetical protein